MASGSLPKNSTAIALAMPRSLSRKTRPGLRVRWRGFWKAVEFDQALAGGADPLASDDLLWRAQQLTEPDRRIGVADTIQRIVDEGARRGPPALPRPRLVPGELVKSNRPLLLVLAERLRSDGPHGLRGLAMVELLVRYGDSPLYRGPSPLQLRWNLLEVLVALDPRSGRSAS